MPLAMQALYSMCSRTDSDQNTTRQADFQVVVSCILWQLFIIPGLTSRLT